MGFEASGDSTAPDAKPRINSTRFLNATEPLLAALLFMACIAVAMPLSGDHHREFDEGLNLMKAALVANGFGLYTDIWSDQPPVFTYILAAVHWFFGENLIAARLTTLAFAGWLAASLFRILWRLEGRTAAWIAVIALAGTMAVAPSAATVVIGLPAMAFAVAGLDQALAGAERGTRWRFVAAGILIGLALQTKMFVAIMLPALSIAPFTALVLTNRTDRAPKLDFFILAAVTLAVFVATAIATHEPIFDQLVQPHLKASKVRTYADDGGIGFLAARIRPLLYLGGALGLVAFALRPSLLRAIPIAWLLTAFIVMAFHRPLRWHHLAMVEVPLAWLTGLAVTLCQPLAWRRVAIVCSIALVLLFTAAELQHLRTSTRERIVSQQVLARATPLESSNHWFVTDRPMDAYAAGLLVPPELAVFSEKRMRTGNLTSERIIESIRNRSPEQIFLVRFRPNPAVLKFIEQDYERVAPYAQRDRPVFAFVKRTAAASIVLSRKDITDALELAAVDLASRSASGGYAGQYNLSTGQRFSRSLQGRPLAEDQIVVRPPGSTQLVGQCFLDAHRVTGRPKFAELALAAGRALACSQRQTGGWSEEPRLPEICDGAERAEDRNRREGVMTLDEGATPKAIDFLMDLQGYALSRTVPPPEWLALALQKSLGALLAIQDKSGGWPQRYPTPKSSREAYAGHFTLNDGAMSAAITTVLKAHRRYGDSKYLNAATLAGEFLLRTQGPETQPGWAQQYDAQLFPAPARKFEPAAYSSHESGHAMNSLLDIYLATRDSRFLAPIASARDWLNKSEIRPGVWARLYEPVTNLPLYGDRDGVTRYSINEISEERRYGYDWEMRFPTVVRAFARHDAAIAGGLEGLRKFDAEERQLTQGEKVRVSQLLTEAKAKGRWSRDDIIVTQDFVDNCNLLLRAIEARQ